MKPNNSSKKRPAKRPQHKPNPKRKQGNSKYRDEFGDENERDNRSRTDARNDISWYSRNPNLLVGAGSFPFPYRPGMTIKNLGTPDAASATTPRQRQTIIPGVLVMDWMPSIGTSNTATDPASILAKEMYSKVRQKFSGSLDADAPDFAVYVLALDSIFAYIAWLKRMYRTLSSWSPENYMVPDAVLSAMGLASGTVENLRREKTRLWQNINELILQTRKFTCPATMDIFNRHYWMSDNVYLDTPNIQGQFFMFNLRALYAFKNLPVDSEGNTGAGLEMVLTPPFTKNQGPTSGYFTVDDFYQFGRDLIQRLVAWDDAYTINGYLMRAYEGDQMFTVAELGDAEVLTPVYVEEVLAQIENSRPVIGGDFINDLSGFNVTQDPLTNSVIANPQYTLTTAQDVFGEIAGRGYNIPPILSIRSTTPTVADNVIASRLQVTLDVIEGTPNKIKVHSGTEIPMCWGVVNVLLPNKSAVGMRSVVPPTPCYILDAEGVAKRLIDLFLVEQFDWHPITFVTLYNANTLNFAVAGDVHNITTITKNDLDNLHKVCIYSELNAFSL